MSQVAVSNLPLPDDCLSIIKDYAYLNKTTYDAKLVKKSVNILIKMHVVHTNFKY